jgi:hypothetical protein
MRVVITVLMFSWLLLTCWAQPVTPVVSITAANGTWVGVLPGGIIAAAEMTPTGEISRWHEGQLTHAESEGLRYSVEEFELLKQPRVIGTNYQELLIISIWVFSQHNEIAIFGLTNAPMGINTFVKKLTQKGMEQPVRTVAAIGRMNDLQRNILTPSRLENVNADPTKKFCDYMPRLLELPQQLNTLLDYPGIPLPFSAEEAAGLKALFQQAGPGCSLGTSALLIQRKEQFCEFELYPAPMDIETPQVIQHK